MMFVHRFKKTCIDINKHCTSNLQTN